MEKGVGGEEKGKWKTIVMNLTLFNDSILFAACIMMSILLCVILCMWIYFAPC